MIDPESIFGFKNLPKPGLPPLPPLDEQREMVRQAEAMDAEFGPVGEAGPSIGRLPPDLPRPRQNDSPPPPDLDVERIRQAPLAIGQMPEVGTPVPEGRKFEDLFPDQPKPVVIQGWDDMMQTLRDIRDDVKDVKNTIGALARQR